MPARCSFETEPWWARASSGMSSSLASVAGRAAAAATLAEPRVWPLCAMSWAGGRPAPGVTRALSLSRASLISLSRAVRRSASRRELAKTIVERWASTRSTMASSTCGQILPTRSSPPPSLFGV